MSAADTLDSPSEGDAFYFYKGDGISILKYFEVMTEARVSPAQTASGGVETFGCRDA